jgi:tetratricopeptide (TPR) repeat protein
MNKLIFALCFIFLSQYSFGIEDDKETVKEIFNNLVNAYGSPKSAPELIFSEESMTTPAIYYATPNSRIVVDIGFFDICKSIQGYEKDAMATVLSHELAHYFNEHTFCSDFAFAIRDYEADLSSKLKQLSKSEKIGLETEADLKGLFYATSAGYNPFAIYTELLDKIYSYYNLNDEVDGYPSKKERIAINAKAQEKVAQLYVVFQEGIEASKKRNYDQAIAKFETINIHFPSRENYNNIGVFKTIKALQYLPDSNKILKKSKKFVYPLTIEEESYLKQPNRFNDLTGNSQLKMQVLLRSAQKDFEKAISLDPKYIIAYVNLACVFDLLGNSYAALGKIYEIPKFEDNKKALQVIAIAYFNSGNLKKANEIWNTLNYGEIKKF